MFDIKAHALMTGQPTEVLRLPKVIREELPTELKEKKRIYGKDLPGELHVVMNNCYSNYGTTNAREVAKLIADYPA